MGKYTALMVDELFARAERATERTRALGARFSALRELRTLQTDFRVVTNQLADAIETTVRPGTHTGLSDLLSEAEELVVSPPPTFTRR